MKKLITIVLPLFIFSLQSNLFAQTVPIHWIQNYNGSGDNTDESIDVAVDPSGNSYVTGSSIGNTGTFDIVTVKYDPNGNPAWISSYNGASNDNDFAYDLFLDASGNVYVCGSTKTAANLEDLVVIKYDNAGNQVWVRTYNNSPANLQDAGKKLAVDASGNVYVCGYTTLANTTTDWLVIKYDNAGNQVWVVTHNGTNNGNDNATDIGLDATGNIFVTGSANETNGTLSDIVTKRLSPSNGATVWTGTYNGVANDNDYGKVLAVDKAGNVIVAGRSFVAGNWFDYATIKYNGLNGTQLWAQTYGYSDANTTIKYEEVNAITTDSLNNVYITGQSQGNGNQSAQNDIATIKYSPSGTQLWVARHTSSGNNDDRGHALVIDDTLNVYVTGYVSLTMNNRDFITLKYNSSGTLKWSVTHDGPGGSIDISNAIALGNDGSLFVTGYGDYNPTTLVNDDYLTIKYRPQSIGILEWNQTSLPLTFFPNPHTGTGPVSITGFPVGTWDKVKVVITGISGQVLTSFEAHTGSGTIQFGSENLPAEKGIYFLRIESAGNGSMLGSGKLVLH
jgi:uncharacterized delta-60 repeat protein